MNFMEAAAIVASEAMVSLDNPCLMGWKMTSQELDPEDKNTAMILAKIIRDCQGYGGTRSIPYRLAKNDQTGFLLIMSAPPQLPIY